MGGNPTLSFVCLHGIRVDGQVSEDRNVSRSKHDGARWTK